MTIKEIILFLSGNKKKTRHLQTFNYKKEILKYISKGT